jgi:prepilin-type N-terminal cleavage/methylation domain-containing protein
MKHKEAGGGGGVISPKESSALDIKNDFECVKIAPNVNVSISGILNTNTRKSSRGFTLLELTIVLMVMGFMTIGSVTVSTAVLNYEKHIGTKKKLEIIRIAMEGYLTRHERLPRPANIKLAVTDIGYGQEADDDMIRVVEYGNLYGSYDWKKTPGVYDCMNYETKTHTCELKFRIGDYCRDFSTRSDCKNCCWRGSIESWTAAINIVNAEILAELNGEASNSFIELIGAVPTEVLGLESKYLHDDWGNKFVYAVTEYITNKSTLKESFIKNKWQGQINGKYVYVVISAGKNQGYSYSRNGMLHHISTPDVGDDDKQNSYDDMKAGIIVENSANSKFDDIMLLQNLENILEKTNIFRNVECSMKINSSGSNCGETNIFFKNIGEIILSYKEKYYSTEIMTIDQVVADGKIRKLKHCIIECGDYGKAIIYPNYTEVGIIRE